MTQDELCVLISKYEAKKSETSIGNIREIVKIVRRLLKGKQKTEVFKALGMHRKNIVFFKEGTWKLE